jgi:hypothetical protein
MVNDLLTLDKIGGLWYSGGGYENRCSRIGRVEGLDGWKAGRLEDWAKTSLPIFQPSN